MKYVSIVWDPYQVTYIKCLERNKRRAARWATSNCSRFNSVSNILQSLTWPTLELRRKISRLSFFQSIIYNLSPVHLPGYCNITNRPTRQYHSLHIIILYTATSASQRSLFPQTIKDWNLLPAYLIEINNNDLLHSLFNYLIVYCMVLLYLLTMSR